ncbi:HEAT repeat domain-containing protein [Streptomyces coeruleofuscus]|uniref:HEAT repeat domain-containing protein n=1 Tax=Streptomyces coeruleofuscus TaxID=66879 RepID=UPI0031F8A4E4
MRKLSVEQQYPFQYKVLLCSSFEEVLDGEGQPTLTSALPAIALERGRVLIQARGGAGKTTTLLGICGSAQGRELPVSYADALNVSAGLEGLDTVSVIGAIQQAAEPAIPVEVLGAGQPGLLLVDGLNEVSPPQANAFLEVVDVLATRIPNLGIVVADRLNRRKVRTVDWQLATLTPVPPKVVKDVLRSHNVALPVGLLGNPYYLEKVRSGSAQSQRSTTHRRFLVEHARLTDIELQELADATFQEYQKNTSRRIDVERMKRAVGEVAINKLTGAGILIDTQTPRFVHHLLSDYLAATHIAGQPALWSLDAFDALTLRATSFDALAMVLEQQTQRADDLLLCVYDWNLYGAAYVAAEDRMGARRISEGMETAILAVLAEKRFDRVLPTVEQVSDALRVHPGELADALLIAPSVDAVISIVSRQHLGNELIEWQQLFCRNRAAKFWPGDIEGMRSPNPLIGWTMANVLRRSPQPESVLSLLRELLHSDLSTVRWRAAHALGASPDVIVIDDLVRTLKVDTNIWVQYGALRSLLEIAAISNTANRWHVFLRLAEASGVLGSREELLRETERTLIVRDPPTDWAECAGLLLERLWADADSVAGQDRWRNVAARLRGVALG